MLRVHQGIVVFSQEDDVILVPFAKEKAGDIGKEIEQHKMSFGVTRSYASSGENYSSLSDDNQILIWGHGNRKRECIATTSGTCAYASDIVKILRNFKLPRKFAGNIILWSCFAGVANGFATTLVLHLKSWGYHNLSVYGPNCPTAAFAYLPEKFDKKRTIALLVWGNGPAGVDMPAKWGKATKKRAAVPFVGGWIGTQVYATTAHVVEAEEGGFLDDFGRSKRSKL